MSKRGFSAGLHPGLGRAVLKLLNDRVDVASLLLDEQQGATASLVAGQAVASAVSMLLSHPMKGPINDVDVFRFFNRSDESRPASPNGRSLRVLAGLTDFSRELQPEYGFCQLNRIPKHRLLRTWRSDLLNFVDMQPTACVEPGSHHQTLLNNFDLNCVQVGVNLADEQLFWTPAYEQFLQTRQMRVVSLKTPVHTAVRWFRKKQEIEGIYGHDESAMTLLIAAQQRVRKYYEDRLVDAYGSPIEGQPIGLQSWYRAKTCFAQGYRDKAKSVSATLGAYFDLEQADSQGLPIQLSTLVSKTAADNRLLQPHLPDELLGNYAEAMFGRYPKHQCRLVIETIDAVEQYAETMRQRRKRVYMSDRAILEGQAFAQALQTPQKVSWLAGWLADHNQLSLRMCGLPTHVVRGICEALDAIKGEKGAIATGVVENFEPENFRILAAADPSELPSLLLKLVEEHLEDARRLMAAREEPLEALMPDCDHGPWQVHEILDIDRLLSEGARMSHCVGGYIEQLALGTMKFFSLANPQASNSLTMGLYRSDARWTIQEISGVENRAPTQEESALAREWFIAALLFANLQDRLKLRVSQRLCLWSAKKLLPLLDKPYAFGSALSPQDFGQWVKYVMMVYALKLSGIKCFTFHSYTAFAERNMSSSLWQVVARCVRMLVSRGSVQGRTMSTELARDLLSPVTSLSSMLRPIQPKDFVG